MNLFAKFEQTAKSQPTKPAFIYFSSRTKRWDIFTYQQLLDSTNRFILGLQALRSNSGQACSLTPGLRAAVMISPSTEFFALAFALLKLGIVPIIVDPAIGLKKLGACLNESQPDIFIGNPLTHTLRVIFGWGKTSIKHNLTINQILHNTQVQPERSRRHATLTTDHSSLITDFSPAAIIFTSGSTGIPKGVLYTRENFSAQLEMLQKTFNISPDEIDLPAFPLYAMIDVLLGVTSVIPDISFPVPGKTDPQKVIDAIQRFNVTNMFASPVVLDILEKFWSAGASSHQQQAAGLQSLKRVITAGAPATIPLQERFRKLLSDETSLYGIYGATETLPIAVVESRELFSIKEKTEQGAGVCLGKPVDGVKVRIIKITDEPIEEWQDSLIVESNIVGEITVQSSATTRGYIQREEANRLSKIYRYCEGDSPKQSPTQTRRLLRREVRPPRNDEMGIIHRMGDVGYFDEEGRLWYCGRKSHRVVINGDVLFTEQIENIFNAHPQVYRTALVGAKGEPVLWVELEKDVRINRDKIRQELMELAKSHPQAARIKTFLFMKKFPTDVRHNSKIIREELTVLAEKRLS